MSAIHDAIREVLRVRDAEREDRASTEDLLDAVAGLEDFATPPAKHQNDWFTSDVEELLVALDHIRQALDQSRTDVDGARSLAASMLDHYLPEPEPLRQLRWFFKDAGYDAAGIPMLPGQKDAGFSAVDMDQLLRVRPNLVALREAGWDVKVGLSDYTDDGVVPFFDLSITPPTQSVENAVEKLLALKELDLWLPEHDEACELLGLDPDNFRANDTDAWGPEQRGRVMEPTAIRKHIALAGHTIPEEVS